MNSTVLLLLNLCCILSISQLGTGYVMLRPIVGEECDDHFVPYRYRYMVHHDVSMSCPLDIWMMTMRIETEQ